jgi:peptidoglycan L-alanyl-D-glutamate endopeptidase CwlK
MAGNNYGATSLQRLATVHPELENLMKAVGEHFPNTILEGERTVEQQEKNVAKGVSKTMNSKHVRSPAEAVDAAPDPLAWPQAAKLLSRIETVAGQLTDEQGAEVMALVEGYVREVSRWYYFGGFVLGYAQELNVEIRWGGDWNSNRQLEDQTFHDLPHFEIKL